MDGGRGQSQKELAVITSITAPSDGAQRNAETSSRVSRRNLDAWALHALDGKHNYPTHYQAALAVASHALARGWHRAQLWEQLETLARIDAQEAKRSPSPRRLGRFINRAWDKAEQGRKTKTDPFSLRAALDAAREFLSGQKFTGRQNSLALVMEAALDAAQTQKTLTPSLAVRSLELSTGLGKSSVARALKKLEALDLLRQVSRSDGEKASTYRVLNTERMVAQGGTLKVLPHGGKGLSHLGTATELAAHDAFRALGRSAARVGAALDALEGFTPQELAQRLGLSAKTVRKALRELEAVGLAYRQRQGRAYAWTARPDAATEEALQRIALGYGTHGTRARREATTAAQRERWAQWHTQKRHALERRRRPHTPAWKQSGLAA